MKKFLKDWFAIAFAAAGMVLMALTLLWRINPVEGSVVPRFLTDNPAGMAVFWLLFITCMPVWMATLMLGTLILGSVRNPDWLPHWLNIFHVGMMVLQGLIYFLIGKAVSGCIRKFRRKKNART
jgi:hypothetical protein